MKKGALDKLKDMKNSVIIGTVTPTKYQETNISIVKYLIQGQKMPGVYVSLNKPYKTIKTTFQNKKIDTNLIIFIDAITKTTGGNISKTKDCLFIGTPKNLSDISLAMDQAVTSLPSKRKFLFFDSINTLLLYNESQTIARFIHFLAGKMRMWNVQGIIISLKNKGNEELINELSQYVDAKLEF